MYTPMAVVTDPSILTIIADRIDRAGPAPEIPGAGEAPRQTPRAARPEGSARAPDALARKAGKQGGGIEPPQPRSFGYDLDEMNAEFALVLMGSKAVIYFHQPKANLDERKRFLAPSAFHNWFSNKLTEVLVDGKVRTVTWSNAWMKSQQRRQYRGVEFFPDPGNAPGTDGYLNLWSGFSVVPGRGGPQSYKIFRDHLFNNVCGGDEALFNWVFGFFAHMVQRPRERVGVALVLRGAMGTGKTKVGEVIGSLFSSHYYLIDDARYITGNFNAHMATCLLLQADEAVWAGDKAAEGRLKGLVTSPFQEIEPKGIDPIRLRNYVRLIMTSNEYWVVPAGLGERRFAVLDVDPRCAKNRQYFKEMDQELDRGGREALLADLLTFDLNGVDYWTIPDTDALREQKIATLPPVEARPISPRPRIRRPGPRCAFPTRAAARSASS